MQFVESYEYNSFTRIVFDAAPTVSENLFGQCPLRLFLWIDSSIVYPGSHSSTIVIARFFGHIYRQDDEGGVGQTNTTARSNPMADARPPTLGDLNGLCFPDLECMMGTIPDPNSLNQLIQNPAT